MSSAAVVIGDLRVKNILDPITSNYIYLSKLLLDSRCIKNINIMSVS